MSKTHLLEVKEIGKSADPRATADSDMVFLWVMAAERKPEHSIPRKYPKDINRKSMPASLWVMFKAASIVGINGEKMILAVKLTKNINAKKSKTGS
jgi:hypothetical protein